MRHKTTLGAVLVTAATAAAGTAAVATGGDATGGARSAQDDCPERALPLPAGAFGPASVAAFESQRARYQELGTKPLAVRAARADFDRPRGVAATRDCGRRVGRRTVVVHLEAASARVRERSPSLSQGVVFVARVADDRYEVWRVVR
jgi:hypothetical protein